MSYSISYDILHDSRAAAESKRSRCGRKRVGIDGWHWVLALLLPIALCQFSVFNSRLPPPCLSRSTLSSAPAVHASSRTFECTIYVSLVSPSAWYIACFSVYNAFAIASVNRLAQPFPRALHTCAQLQLSTPLRGHITACIFATWLAKSQRNNKSTSTLIIYLYIISMVVLVVVIIVQPSKQPSQRLFLNNARIFY